VLIKDEGVNAVAVSSPMEARRRRRGADSLMVAQYWFVLANRREEYYIVDCRGIYGSERYIVSRQDLALGQDDACHGPAAMVHMV